MIVAIDYDNTLTAHLAFWAQVIALGRTHGVEFVCVTNRRPEQPVHDALGLPVVYCSGGPKRRHARDAGYEVAIWIDDLPHLVDLGDSYRIEDS